MYQKYIGGNMIPKIITTAVKKKVVEHTVEKIIDYGG